MPAFTVPSLTSDMISHQERYCQPTNERHLSTYPAQFIQPPQQPNECAIPVKDWIPLIFTVLPANYTYIFSTRYALRSENFPFCYSYNSLALFHWKPDYWSFRIGSTHGSGFHSAVTTCRLSGFISHRENLLFRRQTVCLYLRLSGTTRHLLCFHIPVSVHTLTQGHDKSILLLFPRCQTPDSQI